MKRHDGRPILLEAGDVHVDIGGRPILTGVDLTVSEGEVVGLMGPNGAGKSTLLDVLAGRRRPGRGHVRLFGEEVTNLPAHRRAKGGLGVVLQGGQILDHLTVAEHLQLGAIATSNDRCPAGLVAELAEGLVPTMRAAMLEHASRLDLELATVIATGPRILLLDEPTAGLDPRQRTRIAERIRRIRDAMPELGFLIIEHDEAFLVDVTDRCVLLVGGRLLTPESPDA